jgi:hypothetical protein
VEDMDRGSMLVTWKLDDLDNLKNVYYVCIWTKLLSLSTLYVCVCMYVMLAFFASEAPSSWQLGGDEH